MQHGQAHGQLLQVISQKPKGKVLLPLSMKSAQHLPNDFCGAHSTGTASQTPPHPAAHVPMKQLGRNSIHKVSGQRITRDRSVHQHRMLRIATTTRCRPQGCLRHQSGANASG